MGSGTELSMNPEAIMRGEAWERWERETVALWSLAANKLKVGLARLLTSLS